MSEVMLNGQAEPDTVKVWTAPNGAAYRLHTAKDAMQPQPPRKWLVNDMFVEDAAYTLCGSGGTGKTWVTLDMAVCVATGQKWLEREVAQGGVLVIDEQNGVRRMMERLQRVMRGHGVEDAPITFVCDEHFNFYGADGAQYVEHAVGLARSCKARLIIVDALTDVSRGAKENEAEPMREVIGQLRIVAQQSNATVVILHHTNKGGGMRGSTNIRDVGDGALIVTKNPDDKEVLDFKSEKMRDAVDPKFSARMVFDEAGMRLEPCEFVEVKQFGKGATFVMRLLESRGALSLPEIEGEAASADMKAATARRAVYELRDAGKVLKVDDVRVGTRLAAVYDLADRER